MRDFRLKQFQLCLICTLHQYFLSGFESVGFLVQMNKFQIYLQNGGHYGHLGFPIGMMLAIVSTGSKFRVSWHFGSVE